MSTKHYVHRLTIEISDEQYEVLKAHLHHGYMKRVFGALIEDCVQMLSEFGPHFIHAVLTKRISYRGMVQLNDTSNASAYHPGTSSAVRHSSEEARILSLANEQVVKLPLPRGRTK